MYMPGFDDMPVLHVGTMAVPDDYILTWKAAVDLVFADCDLRSVAPARAHSVVRATWRLRDRAPPADLIYLIASPRDVRTRLAAQGYTASYCRSTWQNAKDERAARWQRQVEAGEDRSRTGLEALERLTYPDWLEEVRRQAETERPRRRTGRRPWHTTDLLMLSRDPIASTLLLLDALEEPVWLDCAYLYEYEEDASISPRELAANNDVPLGNWRSGRILVLTEGRSDARIISAALRALHPALADAYQFIDFDEFRIEGGASPLARMVKILSGVRSSSRMLAIFDNDAAGVDAMRELAELRLPSTVRLMSLPPVGIARRYPTLGPGGLVAMDVNGRAGSIEMYLGRSSLSAGSDGLRPVRWSEWRPRVARYQGAVEGKAEATAAFLEDLKGGGSPSTLRRRFPEMDVLLRTMFAAFENLPPRA